MHVNRSVDNAFVRSGLHLRNQSPFATDQRTSVTCNMRNKSFLKTCRASSNIKFDGNCHLTLEPENILSKTLSSELSFSFTYLYCTFKNERADQSAAQMNHVKIYKPQTCWSSEIHSDTLINCKADAICLDQRRAAVWKDKELLWEPTIWTVSET